MRFSSQTKKSSNNLNPRAERRRKLKLERRNEQLIQLWRILFFSSISSGLGVLLINNGWHPIDTEQIIVKGSTNLQSSSIVNASGNYFPRELLIIRPKELTEKLLNELPITRVSIRRNLMPPHLEVELKERQPIAFATRMGPKGKENGMVDNDGIWMPLRVASQAKQPEKEISLSGWRSSHREWISIILKNRNNFGSPLKKVMLSPGGDLSIGTEKFGVVELGTNQNLVLDQIKVLANLSRDLPQEFLNKEGAIIDIRDPSKPELQLPSNLK